jgi:Family of unknown function (DUF6527)
MIRQAPLAHEFVEYIPAELVEGVLYISIPFRTAVHRCACGCGNKVVTPISPADWQLFYDGDTVSLTPSIGNWGFPCRSHYWIKTSRIRWSHAWTDGQIAAGRARDDHGRTQYFAARAAAALELPSQQDQADARTSGFRPRLLSGVTTLLSRLRPGKGHVED